MRIVFMGTPEFALPSLSLLLKSQHQIAGVVTQPDKPRGRGLKLSSSPVKKFAELNDLKVLTPDKLKSEEFIDSLRELEPDLIAVVAFRILPEEIFLLPPKGTINLHASILPKYRGAAPINWVIINGERITGATTFFIQKKVDTGNIILQREVEITPEENSGELSLKLSRLGAELLLETINLIDKGEVRTFPQDESGISLAPKITEEVCKIDWTKKALEINNLIRGLSPYPGAFTYFRGKLLKVYKAGVETGSSTPAEPGKVVEVNQTKGILVQTGQGSLYLLEVQLEGKKKLMAADFMRGARVKVGEKLG
ncbi:MAG: methionyl-tRNA formyltransferase [candidate division Zixibacteria bacterium]|nr:methionyl-tRNA formyltransferase [candidate division Zixibacteria bacterium]